MLPVSALLDQYKSSDSALVKRLDLTFIQHSVERIDDHDRRALIPKALQGIAKDDGHPQAKSIVSIVLRLLLDIRIPPRGDKEDEVFREAIGLSEEVDAKYLAKVIGIFLRLRVPTGTQTLAQANPTLKNDELVIFDVESPDFQKILSRISEMRLKMVAFLASAAFTDEEKFLPALYAASSIDNRGGSTGEEIIKRTSVSLEDDKLVGRLFKAHATLPAPYRTRILGMLSKSAASTIMTEDIMDVVKLNFTSSEDASREVLQPSSALEKTKLHKALFQYLSWVARIGPSKEGFNIGPELIQTMRSYIELQGWPKPEESSTDETTLRSRAYESIGLLARTAKMPMQNRLDLADWLFRSLSEDPTGEAIVNIDGALSSLTASIPPSAGADDTLLQSMLLTYMYLPDDVPAVRSTRHAVVKWANQCLPLSCIRARWINILAIGGQLNERSDVIEQGNKGLDPWSYYNHSETNPSLPDWKDLTLTIFGSVITPNVADSQVIAENTTKPSVVVFQNFIGNRIKAFPIALKYIKNIIYLSALTDFKVEPGWQQSLHASVSRDIAVKEKLREFLRNVDGSHLVFYLKACLEGALKEDSPIVEECLRCFTDVASLSPGGPLGFLADISNNLLTLTKSNAKEIRALAAKAIGILAAHPSNGSETVQDRCQSLTTSFANAEKQAGSELNAAEGALLALGHLCSRAVYYDQPVPTDLAYPIPFILKEGIRESLNEAALEAFVQLWSAGLALPSLEGDQSLEKVVEKLAKQAKKGNERAIMALGRLALAVSDDEATTAESEQGSEEWKQGLTGRILGELFALHELKQVEVHFTIGDAITSAIAEWDSDHVKLTMDVDARNNAYHVPSKPKLIKSVIEKLLKDCKSTKPSLLKASGIWLFCIVQYCAHLPDVQSSLREAQAAFMRLLNARDELVQETASRGLSLVYERGDPELKSTLVKDLVSAFTGSGPQLKVEEDTELFEPGALPTGEGKSVTSYRDIMNLANEVGDQRLVYKFMSLAANAATWSTRSAFGRFGLSNILSDSEVDPKLYPKLFRYRFDPNSNVQKSMEGIWKALIKDTSSVLDTHFDAIMDDLLKSVLGREWRVRQASCAAISDLLQSRPFSQYEKYYRDVWQVALKVLDDVKGSVREAAAKLCMTLSNSLVRQLEDGGSKSSAKAMMKEALPFLLSDKGVESSVQEVQGFATVTVIKITKEGGKALKPFIPDMVPQLLGLLSSIEPQQINYYYQRAGEDSREKIDKLRSQLVNQSPISEAIENCLRFVDPEVMQELAPRLEQTIKTAIGLPTKIGCCRVLQTLFTRHSQDVKSVSTRLLHLMEKQTLDKNDEVSQAYARSAAYIMRVVPDATKQQFSERFVEMYVRSDEESRRQKIADVIVSLAKVSPDHFTSQETILLPFAYLGSHDTDEYTAKVFKEVWEQHAGSNRTVVRFVTEIVALVERCLDTTQWALRHTAAFCVAAMVSDVASASEATGEISKANLSTLWPVFDKVLALKTFTGKEKLLESFPRFVEKGRGLWESDSQVAAQMKKVALREAKRNNNEYRPHAFRCLWRFAEQRDDLDMLQDIADIVMPYLDELDDEDKMEVDSKDDQTAKTTKEDQTAKTAKEGLEAVARGYNRKAMTNPSQVLGTVHKLLQPHLSSLKFLIIKREVWYDCVKDLMTATTTATAANTSGSKSSSEAEDTDLWTKYMQSIDAGTADAGTEPQRLKRAGAAAGIMKARKQGVFGNGGGDAHVDEVKGVVRKALEEERALDVQRAWRDVLTYF